MNPELVDRITVVLANLVANGQKPKVVSGFRSFGEQQALYDQGRTTPGNIVTHAPPGSSFHNYGLAVDIAVQGRVAYPDPSPFWNELGRAGEAEGLTWGGRWNSPDWPHLELHPGLTARQASTLRDEYETGGLELVWATLGLSSAPSIVPAAGPGEPELRGAGWTEISGCDIAFECTAASMPAIAGGSQQRLAVWEFPDQTGSVMIECYIPGRSANAVTEYELWVNHGKTAEVVIDQSAEFGWTQIAPVYAGNAQLVEVVVRDFEASNPGDNIGVDACRTTLMPQMPTTPPDPEPCDVVAPEITTSDTVTTKQRTPIRSGPDGDTCRLGILGSGETIDRVGTTRNWHLLRTPDGATGWVHGHALTSTPTPPDPERCDVVAPEITTSDTVTTKQRTPIRSGPDGDTCRLGILGSGETIDRVGTTRNWHLLRTPDGATGWVHGHALTSTPTPPEPPVEVPLPDGRVSIADDSGLCLDVPFNDPTIGGDLWFYTCNQSDAQAFTVEDDRVVHGSSGLCLDAETVVAGSRPVGVRAQLSVCAGPNSEWSDAQSWTINGDQLRLPGDRCLDGEISGEMARESRSPAYVQSCTAVASQSQRFEVRSLPDAINVVGQPPLVEKFVWPAAGPLTSPFDPDRLHPIHDIVRPHNGIDIDAPNGAVVLATRSGTVTTASPRGGFGNLIILDHDDGYTSYYAHLSQYRSGLSVGDHVTRGDLIGYIGSTGDSTGPHLHFEIRHRGTAIDPFTVLTIANPESDDRKPIQERRLSPAGAEMIRRSEGAFPNLYNDPLGYCTIGIGHLIALKPCSQSGTEIARFRQDYGVNIPMTVPEMEKVLERDIVNHVVNFDRDLGALAAAGVTQYEYDASASLAFNVGANVFTTQNSPNLSRQLRSGPNGWLRDVVRQEWDHGCTRGIPNPRAPGLCTRRAGEATLLLDGEYPVAPIGSASFSASNSWSGDDGLNPGCCTPSGKALEYYEWWASVHGS